MKRLCLPFEKACWSASWEVCLLEAMVPSLLTNIWAWMPFFKHICWQENPSCHFNPDAWTVREELLREVRTSLMKCSSWSDISQEPSPDPGCHPGWSTVCVPAIHRNYLVANSCPKAALITLCRGQLFTSISPYTPLTLPICLPTLFSVWLQQISFACLAQLVIHQP